MLAGIERVWEGAPEAQGWDYQLKICINIGENREAWTDSNIGFVL